MGTLVAAYDLGLNALMVDYNVRYYAKFPWDRRAHAGRGLCRCLNWINEDLTLLQPEIGESEGPRKVNRTVARVQELVTTGGLGKGGRVADIPEPIRDAWRTLDAQTRGVLRRRPRLYPWYRFGQAIGRCFLDLLDEERTEVLPSLPGVVRALKHIPEVRREKVVVLRRLSEHTLQQARLKPLELLRHVLGEKDEGSKLMEEFSPLTAVIYKVERLDRALKRSLERLPDAALTVFKDKGREPYAKLGSRVYTISYNQALLLEEVLAGEGRFVGSAQIIKKYKLLAEANLSRERKRLPPDLLKLVGTRKGRSGSGYAWRG